MSNIDKQALRGFARSASRGEWVKESGEGWDAVCSSDDQANGNFIIAHFVGPDAKANREFTQAANPATLLALLDELERKDALIDEQDKRLVDYAAIATKSAVRVAELEKKTAFLKEKLAQLANFNPDWDALEATTDSLREHMSELTAANKRIAEMEARTVTVKLPESPGPMSLGAKTVYCGIVADVVASFQEACAAAGINLTVEG